jgi:hypothetical protein
MGKGSNELRPDDPNQGSLHRLAATTADFPSWDHRLWLPAGREMRRMDKALIKIIAGCLMQLFFRYPKLFPFDES